MSEKQTLGMLSPYRVLDLTDEVGQLCGRIMADMGADVIKIERPGGDACRNIGPFYKDAIHPEKNLRWFYLNANKRGITLNLESADGRELFKKLVKRVDFVIENFRPGHMNRLGLDYPVLKEINPRLVMTSISPFGQTGPYQDYKASDMTVLALGTFMFGTGDPDRPPVAPNYPLASAVSSIQAFGASLTAHYSRTQTGLGQHVDMSMQAGLPWLIGQAFAWWQVDREIMHRTGDSTSRRKDLIIKNTFQCKDGYVLFLLQGGVTGQRSNGALARWIVEDGPVEEWFAKIDWTVYDVYASNQEEVNRILKIMGDFFLKKTKVELSEQSGKRGILLGYVATLSEVVDNPQLANRDFWKNIEHSELDTSLVYPAALLKSSATACGIRHRAPLVGEHNEEVYGEIGLTKAEILSYNQAGVI